SQHEQIFHSCLERIIADLLSLFEAENLFAHYKGNPWGVPSSLSLCNWKTFRNHMKGGLST
ncbi:Protein of unknown function, partial [Gryllus bimaculatus]